MVFIFDSNSEIGAHVRSNLGYLICLLNLYISRAVKDLFYSSEKTCFPLSELPSNRNTISLAEL